MKELTANMAGIVVQILVKPGDIINEGMDVFILESMKMQITMNSNITGKVSQIKVKIGDFVNEGDLVLSVE